MRFVITSFDLENHPILRKRGYQAGDIADTKHFEPALKLRPSAQERAEAVTTPSAVNIPTPEETVEQPVQIEVKAYQPTEALPKKPVKKPAKKTVNKK